MAFSDSQSGWIFDIVFDVPYDTRRKVPFSESRAGLMVVGFSTCMVVPDGSYDTVCAQASIKQALRASYISKLRITKFGINRPDHHLVSNATQSVMLPRWDRGSTDDETLTMDDQYQPSPMTVKHTLRQNDRVRHAEPVGKLV